MEKYLREPQRAGNGGSETDRTYLLLGVGSEGSGKKMSWKEEVVFEPEFGYEEGGRGYPDRDKM